MAKKILLVDDDIDTCSDIAKVLSAKGYEVTEAYSGAEALKKVLAVKPDAIILDIMMEKDTAGFEVANQIRSERPTSKYKEVKNVPIIMLTAINQVTNSRFSLDDKSNFLPAINGFLTKPVNFDTLLERVAKLT
ncbi:MAG TPA: response regulator [Spirochaetota bacterium]|nr:response regulator [Spirochaetota bacterium]HOD14436.1 response regulator [Spirochaetota bacterium]HPG52174.1 response regulator [Spirochaetota bacterium]HPN12251.1 response regulator [Spirochaetota bacterium]